MQGIPSYKYNANNINKQNEITHNGNNIQTEPIYGIGHWKVSGEDMYGSKLATLFLYKK